MIIQATKKLQEMLKISIAEKIEDENSFESWNGHVFMLGRKKCLLLTHTQTLYSVFIYGVTQKTFNNLEALESEISDLLKTLLINDSISDELLKTVKNISFVKSSNRSVVSSMNRMIAELQTFKTTKEDEFAAGLMLNNSLRTYGKKYDKPVRVLANYNKSSQDNVMTSDETIRKSEKSKPLKEALLVKIECINEHHEHKNYKKIEILADMKLSTLSRFLLKSFNFQNDHLHKFYLSKDGDPFNRNNIELIPGEIFENDFEFEYQNKYEKKTTLAKAMSMKPEYLLCMHFDFGEDWVFKITKVNNQIEFDPKKKYPVVVETVGVDPIQYPDCEDMYEEDDDLSEEAAFEKLWH